MIETILCEDVIYLLMRGPKARRKYYRIKSRNKIKINKNLKKEISQLLIFFKWTNFEGRQQDNWHSDKTPSLVLNHYLLVAHQRVSPC